MIESQFVTESYFSERDLFYVETSISARERYCDKAAEQIGHAIFPREAILVQRQY